MIESKSISELGRRQKIINNGEVQDGTDLGGRPDNSLSISIILKKTDIS